MMTIEKHRSVQVLGCYAPVVLARAFTTKIKCPHFLSFFLEKVAFFLGDLALQNAYQVCCRCGASHWKCRMIVQRWTRSGSESVGGSVKGLRWRTSRSSWASTLSHERRRGFADFNRKLPRSESVSRQSLSSVTFVFYFSFLHERSSSAARDKRGFCSFGRRCCCVRAASVTLLVSLSRPSRHTPPAPRSLARPRWLSLSHEATVWRLEATWTPAARLVWRPQYFIALLKNVASVVSRCVPT